MLKKLIAQIDISNITDPLPKPDAEGTGLLEVILDWVFVITAAVGVLIIVIAGIRLIISRGDPQATAKARNTIIDVAIGLILVSLAYAIVRVALNVLGG
jgi:hypothetical protein